MGAPLTELVLEQVIRYGLRDLRDKPSKIDMLFDKLLMVSLKTQYGQAEIDRLKDHLSKGKISVVQAWPLIAEKVPCYSLQISATDEAPNQCYFGDDAGQEETITPPDILLSFTPLAYDPVTGIVTLPLLTDLSAIYVNAVFVDAAGQQFEVQGGVVSTATQCQFAIATDAVVTIGLSKIIGGQAWDIAPIHVTPMFESIQIGIHAGENTNMAKYLYYMLIYFLQSRRMELENIGIQIHTFTVTEYAKVMDFLPDNIINRFVNFRARVEFSWKDDVLHGLAHSGIGLKVEKDIWIKSGDFTVLTTDGTEPDFID